MGEATNSPKAAIRVAERRMRLTAAAYAEMIGDEASHTGPVADEVERRFLIAEAAWEAYQRLLGE